MLLSESKFSGSHNLILLCVDSRFVRYDTGMSSGDRNGVLADANDVDTDGCGVHGNRALVKADAKHVFADVDHVSADAEFVIAHTCCVINDRSSVFVN